MSVNKLINEGVVTTLLSAVTTTGAGTSYALPAAATQITWQTLLSTAPSAIHIHLEVSEDNSVWAELDVSTSTTSESRTINTNAAFIRANLVSFTGGSSYYVLITVKRIGAKRDIASLAATSAVSAAQEFAVNNAGTNEKATAAQIKAFTLASPVAITGIVLNAAALPVFADEAAAAALTTGDLYQTAAGAVRIKL